jgi:16S rRNA (guanine(966)-N(2))-methyltransferase RsmD
MVREALFSILGNAVPGRQFFDLFAGTGAVGMEALSRGASQLTLVEKDFRAADQIQRHLHEFGIADQASVVRADVYRWAERWQPPAEPVTIFLGPPYVDYQRRRDDLLMLITDLQLKAAGGSVLVIQAEHDFEPGQLPQPEQWDLRDYGRNRLLIWVKP